MTDVTSTDIAARIFLTIVPLVGLVLVGFLYARKHKPDMSAANRLNIDVFIPALLFSVLSAKSFDIMEYQSLAISAVIIVLGSGVVILPLCLWRGWNIKTFLPPMMFSNAGNLGLPLAVLAFGEAALPAAVVLFLVENALHFTAGLYMLDRKTKLIALLRMPVILASIAGIFWSFTDWVLPQAISIFFEMLGQIAIPLMLVALGVRMLNVDFKMWRLGLLGALLCPLSGLAIALPLTYFFNFSTTETQYLILFAALPPAVLNFMIAEQYQQEPNQVASIVLLGNLGSLLIIPATLFFLL